MGGDSVPRGPPDPMAMFLVFGCVVTLFLTPFIALAALIIALAK